MESCAQPYEPVSVNETAEEAAAYLLKCFGAKVTAPFLYRAFLTISRPPLSFR
ncbi:hypothetical protein D3C72_2168620 [compost metagenome]